MSIRHGAFSFPTERKDKEKNGGGSNNDDEETDGREDKL